MRTLSLFSATFLIFLPSTQAFWRLPCQASPLVVERADPLTNPGGISQHVHAIHGGSNFNLDMNYDDAFASECTSCKVKQDLSNYWTPQLYFAWKNGSFTSVGGGGLLVYYLQRSHSTDRYPIQAFPKDFRMLVGNPYTRSYDNSLMSKAIGWNCLGGEGLKDGVTRNPWLPPVNCPNSLRAEIMFPSCWDGENVDSTNHISHMAYPEDNEAGPCPSSHPKRVVTIFYEIWWSTDPFEDYWKEALNTTQPFVLSTGDPLGYGLHGDFLNGWDIDILQKAIEECTADSGVIEECTIFDLTDYSQSTGDSCVQSRAVQEETLGTIDALPGCNPISYGPEDVTVCNEENRPGIENEIKISGYLVEGGENGLKVKKSGTSETGGEASETKEKEGEKGNDENDETNSTESISSNSPSSKSTSGSSTTPSTTSPKSSPSTTSGDSSTSKETTSSSASEDSSPLSSTFEKNKTLFIAVGGILIVVVLVSIFLCMKLSGSRQQPSKMASLAKENRGSSKEERSLRRRSFDSDSSETSESESDIEEMKSRSRR